MNAMLPSRLYHRGNLIDENGNVSALCFKKPHAIDLKRMAAERAAAT